MNFMMMAVVVAMLGIVSLIAGYSFAVLYSNISEIEKRIQQDQEAEEDLIAADSKDDKLPNMP